MFKYLYLAVVLGTATTPLAVSAQGAVVTPVVTQCDTYVFNCKWDVIQCGIPLGHPTVVETPDSCDHGWPSYRAAAQSDCTTLINRVTTANYTGAGLDFSRIRCRQASSVVGSTSIGVGDTLDGWSCYKGNNVNYIMTKDDRKTQKTCAKTKTYFTRFNPTLGNNQKCGCGSSTSSTAPCPSVEPGMSCLPGSVCVPVSATESQCKRDPMSDHICCLSINHEGKEVAPGKCCLGAKASNGKCVSGPEFKNVTYTGICDPAATAAPAIRKSSITEGNPCFSTPDMMTPKVNDTQADCMLGLRCKGTNNFGFCDWWDKPENVNSCNMKRYAKGCEKDDCQVGTYCHHTYKLNGDIQFTECRPLPFGMPDLEHHDGLCRTAPAARVFKQSLGKCTGVVGTVWGDPHIITFDKLGYNCQGAGDYVFTENCLFKLHGRFAGMENKRMQVSQTIAMAIQTGHSTPDDPLDDSLLQMYFPHKWMKNKSSIIAGAHAVYGTDCPVRILLNGVPLEKPPVDQNGLLQTGITWKTTPLFNISTQVVALGSGQSSGAFYIVDYANGGTARFRIHGGGSTEWNGCVMSVDLCLPPQQDPTCYSDTHGLMGTPDGIRANDWMMKTNQTGLNQSGIVIIPAETSGEAMKKKHWDYCTQNWCITDGSSILPVSNTNIPGTMSSAWYAAECIRPYPGDLDFGFCYNMTRCDEHLIGTNVTKGVTPEHLLPDKFFTCCVECLGGENSTNCKGEEETLTDITEKSAITPDGLGPTITPPITCANLGNDLSGPTGPNAWNGETQMNAVCSTSLSCSGFDDSISVFVGGDLLVKKGEFIEGRIYVGGNFVTVATPEIDDSLKQLGWGPCGSQMCPNTMQTVLEVCGNMNMEFAMNDNGIDIMRLDTMAGFVRFGGNFVQNGVTLVPSNGTQKLIVTEKIRSKGMIAQAADATEKSSICMKKDQLLTPLKVKSKYWASDAFKNGTIFATGTYFVDDDKKEIILNGDSSSSACIIRIDMDGAVLNRATTGWKIVFGVTITGSKTVLINVKGTSVVVKGIEVMEDKIDNTTTSAGYNFDNRIMTKTLWNFPEATSIVFGDASVAGVCSGYFEWQGSILAPFANVNFNIKSHLGRLVVGGSLTVDHPDATFYNYMFNPKGDMCELPKPPGDTCVPEIAPPPPAELACVMESYIETDVGSKVCPLTGRESIVVLDGALGYDGLAFAKGDGIFYGLQPSLDGKTLKFNVNNPFTEEADIYVKHESFFGETSWLDPACEAMHGRPHCLQTPFAAEATSRQFEVGCMKRSSGQNYAQVYVYFATKSPEVKSYTGRKLDTIDKCCHPIDYSPDYGFVEFMFKIDCACPTGAPTSADATRKLRGNLL